MTELYLNDILIDLYEGTEISLNIVNSDFDAFTTGSTKGTFSYNIKVPATKANKKTFVFPELILADSFDATIEKTARIEVDGTVILNGYSRIKSTVIDGGIIDYNIVVFEGNGSWISNIKESYISQIDYSAHNHLYTKDYQIKSEEIRGNQLVTYPVINYGEPEKGEGHWSIEDRYPAFSAAKVFKDIFTGSGYLLKSNFFDSDFAKNLFFTCDERPRRRKEELEPHKFKVYGGDMYLLKDGVDLTSGYLPIKCAIDYDYTVSNIFYEADESKQFEVSLFNYNTEADDYQIGQGELDGAFISSFNGRMSFTWDYTFRHEKINVGGNLDATLGFFKTWVVGGVRTFKTLETRSINIPKPIGSFLPDNITKAIDFKGIFTTGAIEVQEGDTFFFGVKLEDNGNYGSNQQLLTHYNVITNKVYDTITDGALLIVNDAMPKILQSDFVTDLRTMFNLFFYTDEIAKTVYCEPRDEFYKPTAEDWTYRHDRSKPTTISHLGGALGINIQFKYATDSVDKYIKVREKESNRGFEWLGISIENYNKDAKNAITDQRIKSFAATFVGKGIATAPTAKIPLIWETEDNETPTKVSKWESRMLYYNGRTPLPAGEYFKYEGVEQTYYPEFTINYTNELDHRNSLSFGNEGWGYGLYQRYWANTFRTFDRGRSVDMYMKFTSTDILNLDFRTPIYIEHEGDGNYYHLEKIHNYVPASVGVYKCSFIKTVSSIQLADIATSPNNQLTPPYIKDEFVQDEIPAEIIPVIPDSIVMTQMVWTSTIAVPTGEFIEVEYSVIGQALNAREYILNGQVNIVV